MTDFFRARRTELLSYLVVFATLSAGYVGVLAAKPLFVPDSQYYLGMALWFSGLDQSAATEQVIATAQSYGYGNGVTDRDVLFGSGVVQPRVVFPALAVPFIWLFGADGLAVLAAVVFAVFVVFTTRILADRFSWISAVATMVLAMSSLYIVWFSTAILTDSLSALLGAVLLFLAWKYQQQPSKLLVVLLVIVVVLAGFTRQSTLIPAGAFAAAWVMSRLIRRSPRGWGVPALAVCSTTIIVQLIQSLVFAPVSFDDSRVDYDSPTNVLETVLVYMKRAHHILLEEFRAFAAYDHALLVVIGLGVLAMIIFWKHSESHLLAGAVIGLAIYNVGNGTPTTFRYAIPGLVFYLTAVALLLSQLHAVASARPSRPAVPALDESSFEDSIDVTTTNRAEPRFNDS